MAEGTATPTQATAAPVAAPGQAKGANPQPAGNPIKEAANAAQGLRDRDASGKFLGKAGETPAAPTEGAVTEAAKEAMRRHKVKVDGEELEVDEEELKRGYSHQRAANKILQEGITKRKQAEEFITSMRDEQKLMDVIKKLGHDPRKLSEKYLAAQLEDEMMDPRDRELRDTKAKLRQIEEMEKQQREEVQKKRHEELKAKYAKDYTETFVEALKKTELPPTKPMVAEMAKYIARAAKIGFKMTPEEAAQLVKEDIQTAHQRLIGDSDGEILIKLLGEQVANKIRKYDTDKLKSPEQVLRTPVEQGERQKERGKPKERLTPHEWRLHKRGLL